MDILLKTLETYLFNIRGSAGVFTVKIAVILRSALFAQNKTAAVETRCLQS